MKETLTDRRVQLEILAKLLLEKEVVDRPMLDRLLVEAPLKNGMAA